VHLLSFNGVTFTTLGVISPQFDDPTSPGPDMQVDLVPRIGANPLLGGVLTGGQTLTINFTVNTGQNVETTKLKVLAALNLSDPTEKLLVAELNDGTDIETDARVARTSHPNTNTLSVDFVLLGPWRAQTTTTLKTLAADVTNGNFANGNTGYDDMLPVITTYWPASTQRSSSTSTFGWKQRVGTGLTITNNGTEPLINQPYQIGPIDHMAYVTAGRSLASGDDFRVFCEGKELSRNMIGANSPSMFLWVILPTIAPGQAITLDLIINNPSAGSPPTLTFTSTPQRPGMDISGTEFTGASGGGAYTITKAGAGWETNQWAGGTLIVKNSTGVHKDNRRIISNTATVLTLDNQIPVAVGTDRLTIVKSGMRATGGVTTSATTTVITDTFLGTNINEWVGATLAMTAGAASGQSRTVVSNTATAFTVSPAFSVGPGTGSAFRVYQSNGARVWDVRQPPKTTNYPGLWQTNKIQAPPSQVSFDAPGSWYLFTYQANRDTYSQPRYVSFSVGAGDLDHVPIMYIQRARSGRRGTQREIGLADAVGVSTPFPITGITHSWRYRNSKKKGTGTPGEGMVNIRFMAQEAGGELWSAFFDDVTVAESSVTVSPTWFDLSGTNPNRIAMTIVPNGGDEILSADNNTAFLQSANDYVCLSVNPQSVITESIDWIASPPASFPTIYDYSLIMRTGGASSTKPYYQVVIGGTDHRIFVTGTDERIVVDCEDHTATLQTAAGIVVRRIPWAVQVQKVVADNDGATRTLVADRWLPIPPTIVDANAIYFSDPSGAGWGSINIGVTGRKGYRS